MTHIKRGIRVRVVNNHGHLEQFKISVLSSVFDGAVAFRRKKTKFTCQKQSVAEKRQKSLFEEQKGDGKVMCNQSALRRHYDKIVQCSIVIS